MTQLRQKMLEELQCRNYSPKTIYYYLLSQSHLRAVVNPLDSLQIKSVFEITDYYRRKVQK